VSNGWGESVSVTFDRVSRMASFGFELDKWVKRIEQGDAGEHECVSGIEESDVRIGKSINRFGQALDWFGDARNRIEQSVNRIEECCARMDRSAFRIDPRRFGFDESVFRR
jgi:hypothetical protein